MHIGTHLIIELYGCNETILRNEALIKEVLVDSAKLGGATVLSEYFHKFGFEGGVTGVVCIAESHISIHTWPEYKYAALDIFTCSPKMDPYFIKEKIIEAIKPNKVKVRKISRGLIKAKNVGLDIEVAN